MMKDSKQYRILIIEDNPGDFIIVSDFLLEQILLPVITHVTTYNQASDILAEGTPFDIILLDLSLPDKRGRGLVTEILPIAVGCPVIILTGYSDIDFSIKSVSEGISDYLLKDDLNAAMLYKSIIYAIERKKTIAELTRSEKRYSDLFNLSPQPMWVFDLETFKFMQVNKAMIALYGYSEEEFLNMTLMDIKMEDDVPTAIASLRTENNQNWNSKNLTRHRKKNGEIIEVEIFSTALSINNRNFRSVIAIDVTEKNQYENKITRAIIKTQEDERYEIGGELHDNVCQILVGSLLSLGMIKASLQPSKIEFLTKGLDYITLALAEIRNLSHRLAPASFDESTLEAAFEKLVAIFNIEKKIQVSLHVDETIKADTIGFDIQINLYRILQEQLKNILKYAKATAIAIDVSIRNGKLKMTVWDNGVGFNMDSIKNGIGFANMKRRAELFSGKLDVNSSTGNGCTVAVEIPLNKTKLSNIGMAAPELVPVE